VVMGEGVPQIVAKKETCKVPNSCKKDNGLGQSSKKKKGAGRLLKRNTFGWMKGGRRKIVAGRKGGGKVQSPLPFHAWGDTRKSSTATQSC